MEAAQAPYPRHPTDPAYREHLTHISIEHQGLLHTFQRQTQPNTAIIDALQQTIHQAKRHINQLTKELQQLMLSDPESARQYQIIQSHKGCRVLIAANLLVLFAICGHTNYRKLASYLGICPHDHASGTSVRRTPRSTGHGNDRIRKLLYLAVISLKNHDPEWASYYQRKCTGQGKNGHVVINAMENKLLKVLCAMCANDTTYLQGHKSRRPPMTDNQPNKDTSRIPYR